ncbi:MAG TPA: GNAT family N-acetyltransferase [Acidimicrobiia bacterium]|nr:GNAT family N-acetyltransferase [Acidimicrobiia bacterium]
MGVRIRPAEERDAGAIAEFTTGTFSWGDYVAEMFLEWLAEPETEVPVATDDHDRPIALARVRMLAPREGWLSAARVHPEHRRMGLGSSLNDWCVEWVAERGGAVVRLQIETWNEGAHNQVVGLGYRPVTTVLNARRPISEDEIEPATNGGRRTRAEERLDRAPRAETEGAYIAWSTSTLARAAHGLFAVEPWAWRRMDRSDSHSAPTWYCPSGWVMAEEHEDELVVNWMVATPDDGELLARATVDLAQERQVTQLHIAVPAIDWLEEALTANGLKEVHKSRIYERPV